mgnify:CR=1 FL=1
MFDRLLKFSFFGIALLILSSMSNNKLVANELINSSTFTDTQRNTSLDSISLLKERIYTKFSTRYLQDSNIFLRENKTEADIINGSVLLGIKGGGVPSDPGVSYRALYAGNYFSSLSEEIKYVSSADHNFLSGIELRGAFTKLNLNVNLEEQGAFGRSESFASGSSSTIGESRSMGSKKKRLDLGISREISTSLLELGLSIDDYDYNLIDIFSGNTVPYDRQRLAADISWFFEPTFLAKTRLGFGLTTGQEEVEQNSRGAQNFLTPSIRAKWNFSPKTAFAGWVGFDERWRDSDDFSETTPVYGLKGFWTAPTDTKLTMDMVKQVYPSIFEIDDNVATTRFSIGANQSFSRGFDLNFKFFYEFSDYKPTSSGQLRSRTEDLKGFSLTLGKSMQIDYFKESQASIFYNRLTNESTKDFYDYDRDQLGLQFSFSL